MSQREREDLNAIIPLGFKTVTYMLKEWGVLVVIVAAFAWSQYQNSLLVNYVQKDALINAQQIAVMKEQLTQIRNELSEVRTNLRAFELRAYGAGK